MIIPHIQKSILLVFLIFSFSTAWAQRTTLSIEKQTDINFTEIAERELNTPLRTSEKDAEEDENTKIPFDPHAKKTTGNTPAFERNGTLRIAEAPSPKPTQTFTGPNDNGWIPPDVNGAAGLNHLVTTLNGIVTVQNKTTGATLSSVSLNTFFADLYSNYAFDPRVSYDPIANRFIVLACTDAWSASSSLVIAVSATSDPTGNWYRYSVKGDIKNEGVWVDYPTLGFNNSWVTSTANMFTFGGYFAYSQVYVFDKKALYAGKSGVIHVFTDAEPFTLQPCVTYDKTEINQYLIADWTGNDEGKGALRLYKIAPDADGLPNFTAVGYSVVNETWRWSGSSAPQKDDERRINTNDSRLLNAVFKNGSIWTTHTVFLPEVTPTHSGVDWFQVSPTAEVIQFGRIEDGTGNQFYAYPSIAVNDCNDVMIGFNQFSSAIYPSAAYAFRNGTDPLSTIGTSTIFKAGLAPYYKTFGSSRNRWGDYSATCLDPTDGSSFWTLQQYANTPRDRWGTFWAKLQGKSLNLNLDTYTFPAIASATSATLIANAVWTAQDNADWLTVTPTLGATNTTLRLNSTANTTGSARTAQVNVTSGCLTETLNITQKAVCEKVASITASAITPNTSLISWKGVGSALNYLVEWKTATATIWLSKTVATTSTLLENLDENTLYQVRVTTLCAFNDVNLSTAISFTTLPSPCLPTPAPTVTNIQAAAATINWIGTDNAVSYQISYRKTGVTTWTNLIVGTIISNRILTGLTPNTEYQLQILKICSNSPRRVSDVSPITTFKTLIFCPTPTGIQATNISFNKMDIKWTPVVGALQYRFEYKKLTETQWTSHVISTPNVSLSNLTPVTSYQVRVQAICTNAPLSESAVSNIYTFRTLNFTCGAPVTPSVSGVLSSTATVSWKAALNAQRYRLEFKKAAESIWQIVYEGTALKYNFTGLATGTAYNCRITTICNVPPEVNSLTSLLNFTTLFGANLNTQSIDNQIFVDSSFNVYPSSLPNISAIPVYFMKVSPNPTTGVLQLQIGSPKATTAHALIVDYLGRIVWENKDLTLEIGEQTQTLDLSKFSNGVYFMRLMNGDFQATEKIIVRQ